MAYIFQKVVDRVKKLRDAELGELDNCSRELRVKHSDRTELNYSSCYYEFMTVTHPRKKEEKYNCVLIIPEHHAPCWYILDDLTELVEIKYEGKDNTGKEVDLLKQHSK
ncbi:MAG: hypothetical protein K2Y22_06210 [Candidatus Obscuribacterales bacterium]|nr:hypothetical protein [Candidatus Obscuribacterales bacterium]